MEHCLAKIEEIVAREDGDRRSIFQLGYNLGRLSELTGRGREPFWDRWKDAVAAWDQEELARLAHEFQHDIPAHGDHPPSRGVIPVPDPTPSRNASPVEVS